MDQHLQVFITVVEKQNFSRAAVELLMTQPAVSQYIRTFEENIGTRLLERSNKYVRLNKAGEIVYHHAKEIVGLYTRMQHLVDDLVNKASGTLSIGASFTFGEYVLPHIIAKMHSITPDIQPSVIIGNTEEIASYVEHHQLDVGIVEGHFKKEQQLEVETFAEDYMVIVAAPNHPIVQNKGKVTIEELEKQMWILRELGSGTREASENVFQRYGIHPTSIMNLGSTQAIKETVEAGLGISLLSKWAIQKELQNGDLQEVKIEGMPFVRQFSIVTASPFKTKALQVFIDLLRNDKELTVFSTRDGK
ncbi:LysR family transcriptional regulator [Bacillaceae bacterium W0354]